MTTKNKAGNRKRINLTYSKAQTTSLSVIISIMLIYIILAYFVTHESFWSYATFHVSILIVTLMLLWLGRKHEAFTYIAISIGAIGAFTAFAVILYYLLIVYKLSTGN